MKHLIGLLFCLMLFTVGSATAHEKISTKEATGYTCSLDIGKVEASQQVFTIDYVKFREASSVVSMQSFKDIDGPETVKSLHKEKDALLTRDKYIPDCPIVFVRSNYFTFPTQYSCSYIIPYNQPPSV